MNLPEQALLDGLYRAASGTGVEKFAKALTGLADDMRQENAKAMHSDAWYRCRDEYIRDSLRGCDDWTTFDPEATAEALLRVHKATDMAEVRKIIAGLIEHCGTAHANVMDQQGRLDAYEYGAEYDTRSKW